MNNTGSRDAAIAVTRFGLGACAGEIREAQNDPRGYLAVQIVPQGADQPSPRLPGSVDRIAALKEFHAKIRALKQEAATPPAAADMQMVKGADDRANVAGNAGMDYKSGHREAARPLRAVVKDEIFERFCLAASTKNAFRERWALFWANHFTVASTKFPSAVLAGPFEREAIRPHVFGRFEDMLVASTMHPGMLIYLDQFRSTGPDSVVGEDRKTGLNENLAREIMELHTVGATAGYTQADVTEFARALTGYGITEQQIPGADGSFEFRQYFHEPGTRTVMGRTYSQPGVAQARAILADLAANSKTADHIARKLAMHFVSDDPPATLVARLRKSFLDSRGDLGVLARSLIAAPESWVLEAQKFKTPYEFLVSSYRAVDVLPQEAERDVIAPLVEFGQLTFGASQPNGWSDLAQDWAAPDALVKRLEWSTRFANAHAPTSLPPVEIGKSVLGARLAADVATVLARTESSNEALAVLLMSPEFQRR